MLKLYDKNHNFIGRILKYADCKKESEAATGDATLSFTYLAGTFDIRNEYYVQTKDAEYVVKEVSGSRTEGQEIVAVLNLEALEQNAFQEFSVTAVTIEEAARLFLSGTGWTVGECTVTRRRNAGMRQVDARQGILKLCTAFMCEPVFDTKTKTVSFYDEVGEDRGAYFLKGLNLRKLSKTQTSYDFYTRIIPIGADGLTIEGVNGGKNYLENHQYSDKVRTMIWQDDSYTDAQALMDDAEKKLDDLSKPVVEYGADIIDLAAQKPGYGILSYHLGDTVTLIDQDTGTREKQRIRKITEYEQEPEKNTCELGNTVLTFEELQDRLQAAAEIVGYTMTSDGKIHVSDILKWEEGVAGSQAVQGLNSSVSTLNGQYGALSLLVGTINANYLSAEEADLKYAGIERLNAAEATVHSIQGDYASFKSTVTDELSAQTAVIDELKASVVTTDYLAANYAQIDLANIKDGCITTAMIGEGVVGTLQIAGGSITDAKIVELTANKITAGTLSVERLEIRGSEKSIVYALNNITGALQAQNVDTLNGEILTERTITADKIVAKAITANEIAAKTITANSGIIADAAITNAMIANLDAGKITTGYLSADRIAAGSIKAVKIDVTDLFAQDITATGTISGVKLAGATGSFSGDVSASSFSLNGTVMKSEEKTIVLYAGISALPNLQPATSSFTGPCFTIKDKNGIYIETGLYAEAANIKSLYCDDGIEVNTVDARKLFGVNIYENGTALSAKYAAAGHTHNYAGSTSAGGAANSVADAGGGTPITFNYSGQITTTSWIAAFEGSTKVIRAISTTNLRTTIGAAPASHDHSRVLDAGNNNAVTFKYSAAGLTTTSWFAAWNGYELRAINPANTLKTIGALPLSGGTVTGDFYCKNWDNSSRKPVGTPADSGYQVAYVGTHASTFAVNGKWEGSSFASRNISMPSSDIRLKTNIAPSNVKALDIIKKLPIRQFDWINRSEHQQIGFVADELETIDPNLAIGGGYDEGGCMNVKSVDTFYLLGYVVKALQELSDKLDQANAKIAHLEICMGTGVRC